MEDNDKKEAKPVKKSEKKLTIDELFHKSGVKFHEFVGALVAAGDQHKLVEERKKHPSDRKGMMSVSEFKEKLEKYKEN